MHLFVSLAAHGWHPAAWRVVKRAGFEAARPYLQAAELAEGGGLDALLLGLPIAARAVRETGRIDGLRLDPLPLLGLLIGATERIGLCGYWPVDVAEPFHVARVFATLDHLSGGRTGWIAGLAGRAETEGRFQRADLPGDGPDALARQVELIDVARQLWDSWEDRGFVVDQATGTFADPEHVHPIDHAGRFFTVRGPLNVPRPVQGQPVIVQRDVPAAAQPALAASTEIVLATPAALAEAKAMRSGWQALAPDVRYVVSLVVVLGETEAIAATRAAELDALASDRRPRFVGTPEQLAVHLAAWQAAGACDGFDILPAMMSIDLALLVQAVVPLLRRRGLRPAGYAGRTLREHLQLVHPVCRMTMMHLGVFTYPGGHHIAGWRHGSVMPSEILGYDYYRRTAQAAERGKFDLVFVGDMLAAREKDGRVIAQGALNNIDSISILSAVAGATERVGLVATLSTTYNEPFAIAERFATLDHLSGGRAGWNIITTANDDAALNFSRKSHMEKTMRYQRAREFVDVCKSLWDGWEDGAIVADRAAGTFFDPGNLHAIDHRGQFFSVKGALEMPRPPQGWPVMVQAGGSPAGLEFAAMVAEVIFAAQSDREQAIKFRAAVKQRMPGHGRDPAILKVLPGLLPILGSTEKEALAKEKMLNELLHPAVGIWMLSEQMGFRLYDYPQDGPLPTADIRASGGAFTPRVEHLMERADREGLSIRDCGVLVAASRSHGSFVGTPEALVDHMKLWLDEGACDGFNIMPAWFHDEMDLFVDQVVPILQRRGLFRREYEGSMLRDHLGLPIPAASAGRLAA